MLRKYRCLIWIPWPIATHCNIQNKEEWMVVSPGLSSCYIAGVIGRIQVIIYIIFDAIFFIGSILGTIIAIYILWDQIKQISKVKQVSGASKIVPMDSHSINNGQILKEIRVKHGASSKGYKEALSGMSVKRKG